MKQAQTVRPVRAMHRGWAITTACFAAGVLLLTLWPDSTVNSANFAPLREHGAAWSCLLRGCPAYGASARFLVSDVIGNIALFVPIGYAAAATLTGRSRSRRFWMATLFGVLLSLLIETTQLGIATRATDVDDLIFNSLGTVLGAILRRS